jgi:hypothetical protein
MKKQELLKLGELLQSVDAPSVALRSRGRFRTD